MNHSQRVSITLFVITVIGGILRFLGLDATGLNVDEAATMGRILEWSEATFDWHSSTKQIFYYALVTGITDLFGRDILVVRGFSACCGVLTIPLLYLAGKHLHSETCGLLVAAMFAVLYSPLELGQLARCYSPAILLLVTMVVLFFEAEKAHGKHQTRYLVILAGLAATTCATVLLHYFFAAYAAALFGIWAVTLWWQGAGRRFVFDYGPIVFAFLLPLYPLFLSGFHNQVDQMSWIHPVKAKTLTKFVEYSLTSSTGYLWLIIGLTGLGFGRQIGRSHWQRRQVTGLLGTTAIAVLPVVSLFLLSLYWRSLFVDRYLFGSVLALLLIVGAGLSGLSSPKWGPLVAILLVTGLCLDTLQVRRFYRPRHGLALNKLCEGLQNLGQQHKIDLVYTYHRYPAEYRYCLQKAGIKAQVVDIRGSGCRYVNMADDSQLALVITSKKTCIPKGGRVVAQDQHAWYQTAVVGRTGH